MSFSCSLTGLVLTVVTSHLLAIAASVGESDSNVSTTTTSQQQITLDYTIYPSNFTTKNWLPSILYKVGSDSDSNSNSNENTIDIREVTQIDTQSIIIWSNESLTFTFAINSINSSNYDNVDTDLTLFVSIDDSETYLLHNDNEDIDISISLDENSIDYNSINANNWYELTLDITSSSLISVPIIIQTLQLSFTFTTTQTDTNTEYEVIFDYSDQSSFILSSANNVETVDDSIDTINTDAIDGKNGRKKGEFTRFVSNLMGGNNVLNGIYFLLILELLFILIIWIICIVYRQCVRHYKLRKLSKREASNMDEIEYKQQSIICDILCPCICYNVDNDDTFYDWQINDTYSMSLPCCIVCPTQDSDNDLLGYVQNTPPSAGDNVSSHSNNSKNSNKNNKNSKNNKRTEDLGSKPHFNNHFKHGKHHNKHNNHNKHKKPQSNAMARPQRVVSFSKSHSMAIGSIPSMMKSKSVGNLSNKFRRKTGNNNKREYDENEDELFQSGMDSIINSNQNSSKKLGPIYDISSKSHNNNHNSSIVYAYSPKRASNRMSFTESNTNTNNTVTSFGNFSKRGSSIVAFTPFTPFSSNNGNNKAFEFDNDIENDPDLNEFEIEFIRNGMANGNSEEEMINKLEKIRIEINAKNAKNAKKRGSNTYTNNSNNSNSSNNEIDEADDVKTCDLSPTPPAPETPLSKAGGNEEEYQRIMKDPPLLATVGIGNGMENQGFEMLSIPLSSIPKPTPSPGPAPPMMSKTFDINDVSGGNGVGRSGSIDFSISEMAMSTVSVESNNNNVSNNNSVSNNKGGKSGVNMIIRRKNSGNSDKNSGNNGNFVDRESSSNMDSYSRSNVILEESVSIDSSIVSGRNNGSFSNLYRNNSVSVKNREQSEESGISLSSVNSNESVSNNINDNDASVSSSGRLRIIVSRHINKNKKVRRPSKQHNQILSDIKELDDLEASDRNSNESSDSNDSENDSDNDINRIDPRLIAIHRDKNKNKNNKNKNKNKRSPRQQQIAKNEKENQRPSFRISRKNSRSHSKRSDSGQSSKQSKNVSVSNRHSNNDGMHDSDRFKKMLKEKIDSINRQNTPEPPFESNSNQMLSPRHESRKKKRSKSKDRDKNNKNKNKNKNKRKKSKSRSRSRDGKKDKKNKNKRKSKQYYDENDENTQFIQNNNSNHLSPRVSAQPKESSQSTHVRIVRRSSKQPIDKGAGLPKPSKSPKSSKSPKVNDSKHSKHSKKSKHSKSSKNKRKSKSNTPREVPLPPKKRVKPNLAAPPPMMSEMKISNNNNGYYNANSYSNNSNLMVNDGNYNNYGNYGGYNNNNNDVYNGNNGNSRNNRNSKSNRNNENADSESESESSVSNLSTSKNSYSNNNNNNNVGNNKNSVSDSFGQLEHPWDNRNMSNSASKRIVDL